MIQYGIDVYGSAKAGGFWREGGGHNQGRKMPLLFAGTVLNNPAITAYANAANYFIFQEDRQCFYVSAADVARTHTSKWDPDTRGGAVEAYENSDIGLAEWGITHVKDWTADNKAWSATYRDISSCATIGHVLTAHIMGLRSVWNWEPTFDYYDRYWTLASKTSVSTNTPTKFERDMWTAYRGTAGLVNPPAGPKVQIDGK
jgi:hypothetical protein